MSRSPFISETILKAIMDRSLLRNEFLDLNSQINYTILVIIFWHFLRIQLTSESPRVKRYLISSIRNLLHELPSELPNDSRFRILGNQEILEKCQMWVQTQANAQSPFQKLNVDTSCQKTRKIRYYTFEVLPNFIVSLYFVPNILPRIVDPMRAKGHITHKGTNV